MKKIPNGWRKLNGDEKIKHGDRFALKVGWAMCYGIIGSLAGKWNRFAPYIRKIKLIGKRGMLGNSAVYPLKFEVEITDVREHFGRVDYFVKPVGGTGERWVSADTVTVNK